MTALEPSSRRERRALERALLAAAPPPSGPPVFAALPSAEPDRPFLALPPAAPVFPAAGMPTATAMPAMPMPPAISAAPSMPAIPAASALPAIPSAPATPAIPAAPSFSAVPAPSIPVVPSKVFDFETMTERVVETPAQEPQPHVATASPVAPALEPRPTSRRELRAPSTMPPRLASPARRKSVARDRVTFAKPGRRTSISISAIGSQFFAFAAILFAGGLLVSSSVPASAFIDPTADAASPEASTMSAASNASSLPGQSVAVPEGAALKDAARDSFTVTSYAQQLKQRYGNPNYGYPVSAGAVRWPFPVTVEITDGFGTRVPPCEGCSSFHEGIDFVPGAGAPTYTIAKGTVVFTENSDAGLGTQVRIEHSINGQTITAVYGHLQAGSVPLRVGQKVDVGDVVGLVGETGTAFGAHLHFELWVNGTPTDPYAWLAANVR